MLGRPLNIMCIVKAPQRPDIRHRKSLEDAIGHHQCKRLWSLLNRYRLPSLLCDQRGDLVNPLMLALQSSSTWTGAVYEGPSLLAMLLDAKCDPNTLGISQQSPLLYAVGLQNNDAVEDLLIARADANHAPAGFEPPLCVAIRHRMGEIAKTLLTYMATPRVGRRWLPWSHSDRSCFGRQSVASSVAAHQRLHTAHCEIEEAD